MKKELPIDKHEPNGFALEYCLYPNLAKEVQYGITVKDHAAKIFDNIKESYVLYESGHHLANEQPEELAEIIKKLLQYK